MANYAAYIKFTGGKPEVPGTSTVTPGKPVDCASVTLPEILRLVWAWLSRGTKIARIAIANNLSHVGRNLGGVTAACSSDLYRLYQLLSMRKKVKWWKY